MPKRPKQEEPISGKEISLSQATSNIAEKMANGDIKVIKEQVIAEVLRVLARNCGIKNVDESEKQWKLNFLADNCAILTLIDKIVFDISHQMIRSATRADLAEYLASKGLDIRTTSTEQQIAEMPNAMKERKTFRVRANKMQRTKFPEEL